MELDVSRPDVARLGDEKQRRAEILAAGARGIGQHAVPPPDFGYDGVHELVDGWLGAHAAVLGHHAGVSEGTGLDLHDVARTYGLADSVAGADLDALRQTFAG